MVPKPEALASPDRYAAKPMSILFQNHIYHELLYFAHKLKMPPQELVAQAVEIHLHRKKLQELGVNQSLKDRLIGLKERQWLPDIGIKRKDLTQGRKTG